MNLSRDELHQAALRSGLTAEQAERLWQELKSGATATDKPRFDLAHVAYYLGALIVIGAMGWFMNRAWEGLGGAGLFGVSAAYAVCFILGGRTLWNQGQRTPGGLLITLAVCMVPLAVYGLERWTGFWPASDPGEYRNFHPYINSSWIVMEIATVIAGLVALRFWRFPFLTAPIAHALWFLSMDLIELLGEHHNMGWDEKQIVTTVFGALMLLAAYLVDLRGKAVDFAFWGYLYGLLAFWGGLTSMDSNSELGKFIYCLINLGLMFCALALRRRVFMVFGALGFFGYLGHLAYRVFADSILFPFALTLLGLAIIFLGVQYQRRKAVMEQRFRASVLPYIRPLIPARALAD
jgi:uncharacterized membrane protein YidH (DUF202 family)